MVVLRRTAAPLALMLSMCAACHAADGQASYAETLKEIFRKEAVMTVDGRLYVPGGEYGGGSGPLGQISPHKGLEGPEAVPFLIDVLLNGPGWQDNPELGAGILPYAARGTAALNLGAHGTPERLSRWYKSCLTADPRRTSSSTD